MRRVEFISIRDAAFHINGARCHCILTNIHSHQFVRKLFSEGKLACFSRDGFYSTARKYCFDCEEPTCRGWLRLFLKIDGENYALDLPEKLVPVYKRFLNTAKINITRKPLNLPATLSLEPKNGIWSFAIYKG
jgi:hypothetical protein